jgi:flavin reductase (DIM6/NTAB) family NADH-FMN oxidoreductase RutF
MAKEKIDFVRHYELVMKALGRTGLLVGSFDAARKGNLMTIGWGAMGTIWGLPIWIILVRPSRYTYRCIEHSGCFTVNVPDGQLSMACAVCGSKSGREMDKFVECNLTLEKCSSVLAPAVEQCPIVYECEVVHSNDIQPSKLTDSILSGAYVDGDFHRLYYGRILEARALPDADKLLQA